MKRTAPPIPGYEGMAAGMLGHRVRSLSEEPMRALIDYEERHAGRVGVLEVLRHRLRQLENGAEPSGGAQPPQELRSERCGGEPRLRPYLVPLPRIPVSGGRLAPHRSGRR